MGLKRTPHALSSASEAIEALESIRLSYNTSSKRESMTSTHSKPLLMHSKWINMIKLKINNIMCYVSPASNSLSPH